MIYTTNEREGICSSYSALLIELGHPDSKIGQLLDGLSILTGRKLCGSLIQFDQKSRLIFGCVLSCKCGLPSLCPE